MIVPSVRLAPLAPAEAFAPRDPGTVRVGYLSYPDSRPGPATGAAPPLPAAAGGVADGLLVLGDDGRWRRHGTAPDPSEVMRRWAVPEPDDVPLPRWSVPDRGAHRRAVAECLEAIAAGEIYQACLSTRVDGELRADPLETFLALHRTAPAARSAYLSGDEGAVLSFSPEEYLIRRGDEVRSSPIKGTVPAHADPATLRASAKDVAENVMIVDLVRHDLGSVAEIGGVTVTELLRIRPAPGVHHLVSTVRARTRVSDAELVAATFPPASVTGTPKLRARELIAGWEPRPRGLHCGALGLATEDALELAVAIRTLEVAPDGRVELGVGGGITADSDPDAEWEECLHKAAFAGVRGS